MSKKIMIVDDDREYTHLFHQMLSHLGHDVVEITFGSGVYHRLLKEPFHLVLLDYRMKDQKGDTICRHIRSEEKLKDLPLIIVTAARELDQAFFQSLGANEVLYKPVRQNELVEAVGKYLT